jgi:beta-phosphoglucomutase-like phosphatase (HAD superfamily)
VDEVVAAPEIKGAGDFLQRWCERLTCFVVSATPDEEIKEIVKRRRMDGYFKEILGAPASKKENLLILLAKYDLSPTRCCFFGDAESDYLAAHTCGMDFYGIVPREDAPLIRSRPEVKWTNDFKGLERKFGMLL